MDRQDLLSNYTELNNSFKKKTLVYRLGFRYGFFSEYNNMIFAMLYCLENKIRFVLYSKQANFGYEKGWDDYFMPFCEENSNNFHFKHNHRDPLSTTFPERNHPFIYLFKMTHPNHFLTFQLWDKFRDKKFESKIYSIPELGITGDLQKACSVLIKLTWHYNLHTQNTINTLISSVELPKNYIGLHIRGGDKSIETDLLDADKYVSKSKSLSDLHNLFVLTDDYRIIENMQSEYKDFVIYTLCDKSEQGYFHEKFQKKEKTIIKKSHEKLFASIDILNKAQLFIGTFSSNPGVFLGMRMPKDKAVSVDLDKWQIW